MENKQSVGAIWKKSSKKGTDFLSISLELNGQKLSLVAFANTYKSEDKQPDYKIYVSEPMQGAGQGQKSVGTQQSFPVTQKAVEVSATEEEDSQDIPF